MVLAAMPDIEAMEVVERFFQIGARVVETGHPIAIFLAGCREYLAEWQVQVAHGRMASLAPARRSSAEEGAAAAGEAVQRGGAAEASSWAGLPTWANRDSSPRTQVSAEAERLLQQVRAATARTLPPDQGGLNRP